MAAKTTCGECEKEFGKTAYWTHEPCFGKSGSHENEQNGASGDLTSKPYFLGIQQPNQVSGVPGDLDANTYFPSSAELEVESPPLQPPQALGADLDEENESKLPPKKPLTTTDTTAVSQETIIAWKKKLKEVDEIADQLRVRKQQKEKLLQELKTNAAEEQELQEKSQKLKGELNAEVQDLEFAAEKLRQEIFSMMQQFLQKGKLPVEISKLRQDINFKMQLYEQLEEKISTLKELIIQRKVAADEIVKQSTNCIEGLSLQNDQPPAAVCKPYWGDSPGSESNSQTTNGVAVGGAVDVEPPENFDVERVDNPAEISSRRNGETEYELH